MEVFKEKEYYRERIVEMVGKIEDVWILSVIYRFICGMVKERD